MQTRCRPAHAVQSLLLLLAVHRSFAILVSFAGSVLGLAGCLSSDLLLFLLAVYGNGWDEHCVLLFKLLLLLYLLLFLVLKSLLVLFSFHLVSLVFFIWCDLLPLMNLVRH